MRNDYPNHPAGPLPETPDPRQVLEVRRPGMNAWILVGCGVFLFLGGISVHTALWKIRTVRAQEKGTPVEAPAPIGAAMGVLGVLMAGAGVFLTQNRPVTVRVRPDGIDFPADGMPSLAWSEVQAVDIATLVILGAGGAQDYLGIKLQPGLLTGPSSPYSTALMRMVRAAASWDFDICLSQNNLGMPPAHLAMHMRSRLEAVQAQGALPAPPPGLPPIADRPFAQRAQESIQNAPPDTKRMGCAVGLIGMGGFLMLPFLRNITVGWTPKVEDAERVLGMMNNMAFVGLLLIAGALVFVWPWADDEDE